jgi:hypothetical protein
MLGYVYFIKCPANGLIKIGWTVRHPDLRFLGLSAASPVDLEKIGVLRTRRYTEKRLHRRFRNLRVKGEWFSPREKLLAFIAKYAKPWPGSKFGKYLERHLPEGWTISIDRQADPVAVSLNNPKGDSVITYDFDDISVSRKVKECVAYACRFGNISPMAFLDATGALTPSNLGA